MPHSPLWIATESPCVYGKQGGSRGQTGGRNYMVWKQAGTEPWSQGSKLATVSFRKTCKWQTNVTSSGFLSHESCCSSRAISSLPTWRNALVFVDAVFLTGLLFTHCKPANINLATLTFGEDWLPPACLLFSLSLSFFKIWSTNPSDRELLYTVYNLLRNVTLTLSLCLSLTICRYLCFEILNTL